MPKYTERVDQVNSVGLPTENQARFGLPLIRFVHTRTFFHLPFSSFTIGGGGGGGGGGEGVYKFATFGQRNCQRN
jgi:hypothetical protein